MAFASVAGEPSTSPPDFSPPRGVMTRRKRSPQLAGSRDSQQAGMGESPDTMGHGDSGEASTMALRHPRSREGVPAPGGATEVGANSGSRPRTTWPRASPRLSRKPWMDVAVESEKRIPTPPFVTRSAMMRA